MFRNPKPLASSLAGVFFVAVAGWLASCFRIESGSLRCPESPAASVTAAASASPLSADPDVALGSAEWLIVRALEGRLELPRSCQRGLGRDELDAGRFAFCARLAHALRTLDPGGAWAGFDDERVVAAEALLLVAGSRHLPEGQMARAVQLARGLIAGARGPRTAGTSKLLNAWAEELSSRGHLEVCRKNPMSACAAEVDRHVAACLPDRAGRSADDALDALRKASICMSASGPLELAAQQRLSALLKAVTAEVRPEADGLAPAEIRLRLVLLSAFLDDPGRVVPQDSWLAYNRGSRYRLVKTWLLERLATHSNEPTPQAEYESYLRVLRGRGVGLNDLLSTSSLEIAALGPTTELEVRLLEAWLLKSPADTRLAILDAKGLLPRTEVLELAPLLDRMGLGLEAEASYRELVEVAPTDRHLFQLGDFFYRAARYAEAAAVFGQLAASPRYRRLARLVTAVPKQQPRKDLFPGGPLELGPKAALTPWYGVCTPFALFALAHLHGMTAKITFDGVAKVFRSGELRAPNPIRILEVTRALGWELQEIAAPPGRAAQTIKQILDAGEPVVAFMLLRNCHDDGASSLHTTLITGYDDTVQAFLVTDSNWAHGLSQLPYDEATPEAMLAAVATRTDHPVPPSAAAFARPLTLEGWSKFTERILKQQVSVCLD
jgi:hypothetical protein